MLSCKTVCIVIVVVLINPKISSCLKQCMPMRKGITNLKVPGNNKAEHLRLYSNKNTNDEYSSYYSEESYKEGEELARELYELVRIREFKEKLKENESQMQIGLEDRTSASSLTTDERTKREQNPSAFSGRREMINGNDNTLFTSGKSAYFTTSENSRQDNLYATSSNAKRQILEQEFNLVNMATNERTILIQAAVLLICLVFYLYIGFMGGITSGTFNMEDMMDFELDYEQVESNTQSLWI